ncbi:MAG: hypothetical protein H8D46_00965 [FCB group bacterium]|nr:hypothetical protein [FCB group bacterium]
MVFTQVYTSYHWHLQQPIYWPDQSEINGNTYQFAWESLNNGGAHPENDLEQIFGWADRVAAYQYRIRDSIQGMNGQNAGAQISYGGCLIENVMSLANHNSLGYSPGWQNSFQEARSWLTTGGYPRLDVIIFPYHHSLAPLIDENALRKEIQIYKELYPDIWGSGQEMSVGMFPPELSFSERMIKVLDEEGIDWVFVGNNHISRACENFPLVLGTAGENCDPPNPADQINPPQNNWFNKYIDRGCSPTNAYPYAYQPHYAQYIDPETGTEYRVIVVPVAQAMSWTDGYQLYGVDDIDQIAWANDPDHPMLVVLGHDGDNAWGGGYSYYLESVPNFTGLAQSSGYMPTVVSQYLSEHPVDWNDVVHVEDGSWVNADGDFGSPDFINWNWPLFDQSGNFDIANGWAEDERNWAVITAAQNRVETAEQISGGVDISAIQDPVSSGASSAELAWHFFLPALTSGYMYYGTALDMEVKATIACNNAVSFADAVIGDGSSDQTPPTIWIPQQLPHNPGGIGFGSLWGYQQTPHSRDFWVWTFIHDVSGVASAEFCYRTDNDGENPIESHANETYTGGPEVSDWVCLPMTQRTFPAGNVYNNPNINFFEMPQYIADQYYIHVEEPVIVETGGVLVDYYVQASDAGGFTKKSPILHTYVGTGDGSGTGVSSESVNWYPEEPQAGETLEIYYDLEEGSLPNETDPVYIHIGHSGWQGILDPDPAMVFNADSSAWLYSYSIPEWASTVDFVFNDGSGTWDNNSDQDWHVPIDGGSPPEGFVMDGILDTSAELIASNESLNLWADYNGTMLYLASTPAVETGYDHFILIGEALNSMIGAPWAKAGDVPEWSAYIGNEASNGWIGWFDLYGGTYAEVTSGTVNEAVISVENQFGENTESIWITLAGYQSADGGALMDQLPVSLDDNSDIDSDEVLIYYFEQAVPGDVNTDGVLDILDIVITVDIIMGNYEPTPEMLDAADVNNDGAVDVLDIVIMVETIMTL